MQIGYTLSSEEHGARELVDLARRAEDVGFDYLSISDHFLPWVDAQGHSPFVWSTLGGVAMATSRVGVGVGVTCPILRIHPAVIAHAAATTATMFGDRFFLGLGTGELLNEHVLGQRWPRIETRQAMLAEAIDVMRLLWSGKTVDHDGAFFTVENARVYDLPEAPIPVLMSAFGPASARVAAELGCGLWTTGPDDEVLDAYRGAGGEGPIVGQLTICWAESEDAGIDVVGRVWPTKGLSGQLSQELPSPALFEQASAKVRREDLADAVICGPATDRVLEALEGYRERGYTKVHLHQVGHDQSAFFDAWTDDLQPQLGAIG